MRGAQEHFLVEYEAGGVGITERETSEDSGEFFSFIETVFYALALCLVISPVCGLACLVAILGLTTPGAAQ